MNRMSRYQRFDVSRVQLADVGQRGHDHVVSACLPLEPPSSPFEHPDFGDLVARIVSARRAGRPVILSMGAHPIKLGLSRYLVDLIERGWITLLAGNGAVAIHDFELATLGGTSENVGRWIREGQFGLWQQTSRLNQIVRLAADRGEGLGEALGRTLEEELAPHRALSLAAAGWRANVPVTIHVGIGHDIVHMHPNCDGAAWGQSSYTDFLIYARQIQDLEGGVFLNIGTAIMGPEVYLKALSMARNVARQQGFAVRRFTTAVFDLESLPEQWRSGEAAKDQAQYYFRPWKTILLRTVADGGMSYFFSADHRQTIPALWQALSSRSAASPA